MKMRACFVCHENNPFFVTSRNKKENQFPLSLSCCLTSNVTSAFPMKSLSKILSNFTSVNRMQGHIHCISSKSIETLAQSLWHWKLRVHYISSNSEVGYLFVIKVFGRLTSSLYMLKSILSSTNLITHCSDYYTLKRVDNIVGSGFQHCTKVVIMIASTFKDLFRTMI